MVKVEIEVTNLDEIDEALQLDPDALLLDNMDVSLLRAAVKEVAGRVVTEASGGVNLDTVRAIAETGRRPHLRRRADAFGARARYRSRLRPADLAVTRLTLDFATVAAHIISA